MDYSQMIDGLAAPGTGKFQLAKQLLRASESHPGVDGRLYSCFAQLRRLLQADNNIVRWTAIRIIANLAPVDTEHRIAPILKEYLAPIRGPVMITAAHTIMGAARIAAAQPRLRSRIIPAILGVEQARYQTPECRNIAIGHAITALGLMGDEVRGSAAVMAFVERQKTNPRANTSKKAEKFLRLAAAPRR